MSDLVDLSSTFVASAGGLSPQSKPVRVSTDKQYVAGGLGIFSRKYQRLLTKAIDDVERDYGPWVYESMMTDPVVGGTMHYLICSILSGGWMISPAIEPTVRRRVVGTEPADETDVKEAAWAAEFCQHIISDLNVSFDTLLYQIAESMVYGNRLFEYESKTIEGGDYAGSIGLAAVTQKPRDTWMFVVDIFKNLKGIWAVSADTATWLVFPVDKFLVVTWDMRDNDPRGRSILRKSYHPWNLKVQTWPDLYKFLTLYGTPILVGEVAEGAVDRPATADELLADPTTQTISPERDMMNSLTAVQSGAALAHPSGAKVYTVGPIGGGETAIAAAIELYDRQIVTGILSSSRGVLEAQYGSRADSQSAQDNAGCLIRFARRWIEFSVRQIFKTVLTWNKGEEYAAKYTPSISLGDHEHQDQAGLWTAVSALMRSGYIGESQLNQLDAMIGLPPRNLEADKAAAEEAAESEAERQKELMNANSESQEQGGESDQ